jgi:hypothetical protein
MVPTEGGTSSLRQLDFCNREEQKRGQGAPGCSTCPEVEYRWYQESNYEASTESERATPFRGDAALPFL